MTHAGCGGTLSPEWHDKWVYSQQKNHEPVLSKWLELLHRCSKCGLVAIAVELPEVLAVPSDT